MGVCVRKISKSKWPDEEVLDKQTDEAILPLLKADALTSCLRTSQDELSLWTVENTNEEEIEKAILALITNSRLERLDRIQVVYFDEDNVKQLGLTLKKSPGDTVISTYTNLHQDMIELNFEKMGKVSALITSALRDKRIKKYNEKKLTALLTRAIESGLVEQKKLHMLLQHKLGLDVINSNGEAMTLHEDGYFIKNRAE
jgi:transcriptional regulator NrdR family protein